VHFGKVWQRSIVISQLLMPVGENFKLTDIQVKRKKEADLYSAFIEVPYTLRRSGTDHTVLPANYTVPASTS